MTTATLDTPALFTPAITRRPAMEYGTETPWGSVYARYFPDVNFTYWLAYVRFSIGDNIDITRNSPQALRLPTEDAARAWCEAAMDDGPQFLVAHLESMYE